MGVRRAFVFPLVLLLFGAATPLWWTLANVWTDSAMLSSFALALGMVRCSAHHQLRWVHALALLPLLYGSLVRLNALPTAFPLFALWWISRPARLELKPPTTAIAATLLAFSSLLIGVAINRTFADERVRTWPVQALHDLAGISLRTGTMLIPSYARQEGLTLDILHPAYVAEVAVPILLTTPSLRSGLAGDAYTDTEARTLAFDWLAAIASEPGAYVAHRAAMMWRMWIWPNHQYSYPIAEPAVQYKDNPAMPGFSRVGGAIVQSLTAAVWRVHFSLVPYLLIAVATLVIVYRRWRNGAAKATMALPCLLLVSACMHLSLLAVFAPASDSRYVAWPICAIMLATVFVLAPTEQPAESVRATKARPKD